MMKKQNYNKSRKITREYLVGAAYRYLEKFASTQGKLKEILRRKTDKILYESEIYAAEEKADISSQADIWIDEITVKAVAQGLINDYSYSLTKARSLIRSGNSTSQVTQKLFAKLVPSEMIDRVLEEVNQEMPEANKFAAAKYIRKRRFGGFRLRVKDEKAIEKEKSSMYRAGFEFGLVEDILKMDLKELEDIIFGAENNI